MTSVNFIFDTFLIIAFLKSGFIDTILVQESIMTDVKTETALFISKVEFSSWDIMLTISAIKPWVFFLWPFSHQGTGILHIMDENLIYK